MNASVTGSNAQSPPTVHRVNEAINLISNAYLRYRTGGAASIPLLGMKDMPMVPAKFRLDFSSLLGALFFLWLMQMLLPVFGESSSASVGGRHRQQEVCSDSLGHTES